MEIFKRKILLESLISRSPDFTYGTITGDSIYIKVFITQNVEDMGIFTDTYTYNGPLLEPYSNGAIPNTNNILVEKLTLSGITFPFMTGATTTMTETNINNGLRITNSELDSYTANTGTVTGLTDSKLLSLRGYVITNPYVVGFDINKETYVNYTGQTINGVSRIVSLTGPTGYTFDAKNDIHIGTSLQKTGIYYNDFNSSRSVLSPDTNTTRVIGLTNLSFKGEGWNESNISLSAITKEELYFGITRSPEIYSDIFIERGNISVLESHMRLSEVKTMDDLVFYGNGFYKIITQ